MISATFTPVIFYVAKKIMHEPVKILLKNSEDGVKEKIGFWAMPLPDPDDNKPINKKYLGKK